MHSTADRPRRRSLRERILDGNTGAYLLLAPTFAVLGLLTVWPLIYSVGISFTDFVLGSTAPAHFIGAANYVRLVHDSILLASLVTTVKLLVIAVPLQLLFGYLCATVFRAASAMPGVRILRTVFILPTMITPLCIALFWAYIFDPLIGVANALLPLVHLAPQPWFADVHSSLPTLVFVYLWEWTPFTTVLFLAGLLAIPGSIYEAARIDGARAWDIALRIDLPLLGRVIVIATILAVVEVLRLFDLVYGTTQGGPGTSTLTNAVEIYRIGFQNFDMGYAAAASLVVLFATSLVAGRLTRRLVDDAETKE